VIDPFYPEVHQSLRDGVLARLDAGSSMKQVLGTLVFLIAAVVTSYLVRNFVLEKPRADRPAELTATDFDETISTSPQSEMFKIIETDFPDEYDAIRRSMVAKANDASSTEVEMFKHGMSEVQQFVIRNQHYSFYAPDSILIDLADGRADVFQRIQNVDENACGALAMSRAYHSKQLERLETALLPISVLNMKAMAAGKNNPSMRMRASQLQWEDFWSQVSSRLTEKTLSELATRNFEQLSPKASCDLLVQINIYVSELPDTESAFWVANLDGAE
jgi:hypothetical protein